MDQADNLRTLVKLKDKLNILQQKEGRGETTSPKIYSVTSGKGGVGKTNITLNMAISLAKQGKKVLVLDADFGTANVDIILGVVPKYNISHMLLGNIPMEEVVLTGPHDIRILPGVSGIAELTTLTEVQRESFFDQIELYQAKHHLDYIFIDTGAGLGNNVINFLLASDEVLLVVTPEPTALSDAYAIVKILSQYNIDLKVSVIVNMAKNKENADRVFHTIDSVGYKFLDKRLYYLGFLKYDKSLPSAVRLQKPLLLTYPNSEASLEILKLSKTIINENDDSRQDSNSFRHFFEVAGKYFGWNND